MSGVSVSMFVTQSADFCHKEWQDPIKSHLEIELLFGSLHF